MKPGDIVEVLQSGQFEGERGIVLSRFNERGHGPLCLRVKLDRVGPIMLYPPDLLKRVTVEVKK